MQIVDCIQGTDEWFQVRSGKPTASCFDKIVTSKGEPSKSRQAYMYKLAGEFIAGKPEETYQNAAMQRGTEMQGEAQRLYELVSGNIVTSVGFCLAEEYGCSPDGLVHDDGMIQIKCPSLAVHVAYLIENKLPTDYFQQVQGELFVAERKWSDFISYYPGIKPMIVRVNRDEKFIALLKAELQRFCEELKQTIKKLGDD